MGIFGDSIDEFDVVDLPFIWDFNLDFDPLGLGLDDAVRGEMVEVTGNIRDDIWDL